MFEEFKEMTIGDVIKYLPLDTMVKVLKHKGLTNSEVVILLKEEKKHFVDEEARQSWLKNIEELLVDQENEKKGLGNR